MSGAGLGSLHQVVGALVLVGGDEVGIVDARQRDHVRHLLADHGLERRLEDGGAVHGVGEVHAVDVPAADDQVVGMGHGQHVVEGHVDVLARGGVGAELERGGHEDGAVVVGGALALARVPDETEAVGQDSSGHGAAVVAAPSDEHHADTADIAFDLEVVHRLPGLGLILGVGQAGDVGGAVCVLGPDLGVGVDDVGRVDDKERTGTRGGTGSITVAEANIRLGVGRHVSDWGRRAVLRWFVLCLERC